MNKSVSIFVIIVTYKGHQWYDRCFTSLRESSMPLKTIVVDNASDDGTVEYIREHFPEIHLIESKENLGFGRANNLGMRYALDNGCDYVFLLNQDTWIENDTLQQLIKVHEKHPEYGILSPIVLNSAKDHINMMIGLNYDNRPLISDLYFGKFEDVYETNYVSACSWLMPRKTLEMIGGFDPIFFHYEEDDNYIHRAYFHGLKIGISPKARMVHDHCDSVFSNESIALRKQQFLLAEWTNINNPFSIHTIVRYYLRKWFLCLLSMQIKKAQIYRKNLLFCIKMRKAILSSRNNNKQPKTSWL